MLRSILARGVRHPPSEGKNKIEVYFGGDLGAKGVGNQTTQVGPLKLSRNHFSDELKANGSFENRRKLILKAPRP